MEIAERLGDGSTTWMSTIYRTLELLETKDIVTRTTLMGSDMAIMRLPLIRIVTMQYVLNVGP